MVKFESKEYVIVHGKKYPVKNNILELITIPCRLSEVNGLENLNNLEGLFLWVIKLIKLKTLRILQISNF